MVVRCVWKAQVYVKGNVTEQGVVGEPPLARCGHEFDGLESEKPAPYHV